MIKLKMIAGTAGILALMAGPAPAVTQTDVVGYWTHQLQPGFNLVAFPVLPDTPTPQAVIGEALGAVEVTTWDEALHGWRWAKYDPDARKWSGDLFLLRRGVAYWINLMSARETRRLIVTGHPELYTKFRWNQLHLGRQFYASTYGKSQALDELPPQEGRDVVINWDSRLCQFQLAEASGERWRSPDFDRFAPDHAYIVDLHHSAPRSFGPPLEIQINNQQAHPAPNLDRRDSQGDYTPPPRPLIIGNINGLPVRSPHGEASPVELSVTVYRERVEPDGDGNEVPVAERLSQHRALCDPDLAGRFRLALAVGEDYRMAQPGDRIYLVARDGSGAETRSTSFEVPDDDREVTDLSFNEPLSSKGESTEIPQVFSLGTPFPNPFNDRFSVEVRLPETGPVEVALFDVNGRAAMKHIQALSAGAHRLTIKAEGMAAGIYLLKISAGGAQGMAKVAYLK